MAWPKGKMPEEKRAAMSARFKGRKITWGEKISESKKGIATSIQKGDKRSPEVRNKIKAGFTPEGRKKIRAANRGKEISTEHRQIISTLMKKDGRQHFTGGKVADAFAEVLCPAGFIREYRFYYARGIHSYFQLDFAHLEGKICIELDGPSHFNGRTPLDDKQRDEVIRHFSWRVIRIKHGKEL